MASVASWNPETDPPVYPHFLNLTVFIVRVYCGGAVFITVARYGHVNEHNFGIEGCALIMIKKKKKIIIKPLLLLLVTTKTL